MRAPWATVALAVVLLAGGCSAVLRGHGYAPKPDELSAIVAGVDTQDSVRDKIGRPGGLGVINKNAWYYVASTVEHYAYREPAVIDRTVVAILFDDLGTVTDVRQFGIEDGRVIDLVTRTTPTYGKELTVVQQLLGNLLNFNAGSLLQ
jgi:outer membrane protein assembly factor BamE (lipoprotein component of BamABCDE complex)